MMTPTCALNRFAAEYRKRVLYPDDNRPEVHYGFRIGELNILLRPLEKVEVIESMQTCPVPNTPGWFSGMINLRGELLPVFDIGFLLNKNPTITKYIMVIRHENHSAGIYIDTLPTGITPEILSDSKSELPDILGHCVDNIYKQDDNIWLETNFEKFFQELRNRF